MGRAFLCRRGPWCFGQRGHVSRNWRSVSTASKVLCGFTIARGAVRARPKGRRTRRTEGERNGPVRSGRGSVVVLFPALFHVVTSNYTQERSVNHSGAQLLRIGIVAGRSGKR